MREREASSEPQEAAPEARPQATGVALASAIGNRAFSSLARDQRPVLARFFGMPMPALPALEVGDIAWHWEEAPGIGLSYTQDIPRQEWFPGSVDENDYKGHGKEIFQYVVYADHVKRGQPHLKNPRGSFAWLNNNPGNLTAGGPSVGEIPGKLNWHNFLIFETREDGIAAIGLFLKRNGYGPLSMRDAMKKYAPGRDRGNDPAAYARTLVAAIGPPVTEQTTIDALNNDQMERLTTAIAGQEGTAAGDQWSRDDARIPFFLRIRL